MYVSALALCVVALSIDSGTKPTTDRANKRRGVQSKNCQAKINSSWLLICFIVNIIKKKDGFFAPLV